MREARRGEWQTDEDIGQNIHDLFALDRRLNPANIRLHVANGKVFLSGVVTSHDERRLAGDLARCVPGVAEVVNEIVAVPTTER